MKRNPHEKQSKRTKHRTEENTVEKKNNFFLFSFAIPSSFRFPFMLKMKITVENGSKYKKKMKAVTRQEQRKPFQQMFKCQKE